MMGLALRSSILTMSAAHSLERSPVDEDAARYFCIILCASSSDSLRDSFEMAL
jgi:hypothetical protein